jgi:ribosomal protein L4
LLRAIGAERGAVVALDEPNDAVYRSGRNIPRTEIRTIQDLNACEVLRRPTLVFTQAAFEILQRDPVGLRPGRIEHGDGTT